MPSFLVITYRYCMTYYVLVEPWATYVKTADYFEKQGGCVAEWGKRWQKIEADSIEDARQKAGVI